MKSVAKRGKMSLGIILTGTIIPNSNFVQLQSIERRRRDYLNGLRYYSNFGCPVWFLENSEYDINKDDEFNGIPGVTIFKSTVSDKWEEGKGYQEFEMIDNFIKKEESPSSFIKITGRYIIEEFEDVIRECSQSTMPIIANYHFLKRCVDTYMIYFDTEYYRENLMGLYREVNDRDGRYIEHVYYDFLKAHKEDFRIFLSEKNIIGVSGSSGAEFRKGSCYKRAIKNYIRRILVQLKVNCIPW